MSANERMRLATVQPIDRVLVVGFDFDVGVAKVVSVIPKWEIKCAKVAASSSDWLLCEQVSVRWRKTLQYSRIQSLVLESEFDARESGDLVAR